MGSWANFFLVILCNDIRPMNLHMPCKFVVVPRYMAPQNISAMVLVRDAFSWVSTYVTKYTLQCLEYYKLQYYMMVLWEYICDIPPTGGKEFRHITKISIISMTICPGSLLNGRVLHMDLVRSLITLICHSISGT